MASAFLVVAASQLHARETEQPRALCPLYPRFDNSWKAKDFKLVKVIPKPYPDTVLTGVAKAS